MRALVIKTSSLGDVIHGLRVATSLKAQVPGLHLTWVAQDAFAPLVQICEAADRTVVFKRKGGLAAYLSLIRSLRAETYDAVLDMQGRLVTGLMAARCRSARKIGRTDSREGSGFFYTERVPLPPEGRRSHAVDILLQFCRALGARPVLTGPPVFREIGPLQLSFADHPSGGRPIVVFPDSRRAEKRWNGFAGLTELLLRGNPRRKVIWAGDRYLHFAAERNFGSQFLNLTGNTSLVSLPSLVRKASWILSNDSGPMHLAAALGVKVLGVFGPTDTTLYGPYPFGVATNHFVRAPVGNLHLLSPREVLALLRKIDPEVFG